MSRLEVITMASREASIRQRRRTDWSRLAVSTHSTPSRSAPSTSGKWATNPPFGCSSTRRVEVRKAQPAWVPSIGSGRPPAMGNRMFCWMSAR
ncbi:hypothetical protein [Kitasatospora sp. CMC57]|uniref:hypothetical protein n=1 Tax=Kitasatospora sp. CMC57 TaxID=3231513 RepID=UPI0038B59F99